MNAPIDSGCVFDFAGDQREIEDLERQSGEAGFWEDMTTAQGVMRRIGELRARTGCWQEIRQSAADLISLAELADGDEAMAAEIAAETDSLVRRLDELELQLALNGPHDRKNAILVVHSSEGGVDARPDRLGRDASVLEAEGHLVAGPPHDQLGLRVLEQEPGSAARPPWVQAVDEQGALRLRPAARVDEAGQRREQRRLAGTGRPEQQDALPWLDDEVHASQRPRATARVPQPPATGLDARRARRRRHGGIVVVCRRQTSGCSRPIANPAKTPVARSARRSSHDPRPAMSEALSVTRMT